MAQMIPPTPGEDDDEAMRQGELDVFKRLEEYTPHNWIALHSLRLKTHKFKKSAEADFVLITDKGVLVIEVKGGKNNRNEKGQWVQAKKGKKDRISNEGPFKQAMGAYFAIEKYIKNTDHKVLIDHIPWGWGVIMPHCVLTQPADDPEIDPEMLLDQKGFPEGLIEWVTNLVEYWRVDYNRKNHRKRGYGHKLRDNLPTETRVLLVELLRPRFEVYMGLGQATRQAEQNIIKLTEKQCLHLLTARSNPRALLEGSAGTGKTLLAFEFAMECAQKGEKILLVCYNVNLAYMLQKKANERPDISSITIKNFHQLVKHIRMMASLDTPFTSDWESFNKNCFDLVAEALDVVGDDGLFDRIILDEGQDLMSEEFLNVLDLLLKDGLSPSFNDPIKGGKWFVAMDKAQLLYAENFEEKALKRLERCMPAMLQLDENCRNTRPVASHVYGFSHAGSCQVMNVEGPEPIIDYFKNEKTFIELLKTYINDTLIEYAKVDQLPNDIALLTARKDLIPDVLFQTRFINSPLKRYKDAKQTDVIWETIHGFKGLEASTVILIGVEELEEEKSRQLMYVGGSRARTRLIWLLPEMCARSVQKGLVFIQKQFVEDAVGSKNIIT